MNEFEPFSRGRAMSDVRKRVMDRLQEEIQFKQDLRSWRGMELSSPDREELGMIEELTELSMEINREEQRETNEIIRNYMEKYG